MTQGVRPVAISLDLPRIAQGRLGPSALQGQCEEMALGQTLMPCGGLTRRQIDSAGFPRLPAFVRRLFSGALRDHG